MHASGQCDATLIHVCKDTTHDASSVMQHQLAGAGTSAHMKCYASPIDLCRDAVHDASPQ